MVTDDSNQSGGSPSTELLQQIHLLKEQETRTRAEIAALQQRLRDISVERQAFEKAGRLVFGETQFNALLNSIGLKTAAVAAALMRPPTRFAGGGGLMKLGEEISKRKLSDIWGRILAPLVKHDAFSYDDVQAIADAVGHDLKTNTLRSQMKVFVDDGLVERIDNGKFKMTDAGARAADEALLRSGVTRPAFHMAMFDDLLGGDPPEERGDPET
ncbi:hypothetical protein E0H39_29735 [Rhizobium leguminosarum bv. viciae]|uniref:hypothetical protein n=1 Tax=Rhizobium leguminosarum TaxID=384 RepID=UPI00104007AA|nr:hypothetical protein [Rhizobium leguminosarum]TBY57689.1 hypothetical protein E0H39_29735 [Rhizobium leguminosarum bv. viciae]